MNKLVKEKQTPVIDSDAVLLPVFSCKSLAETLRFYRALGMEVTHEQTTPYEYGAVQWGNTEIDFHGDRKMKPEQGSSCILLVNEVETPYRTFADGLQKTYNGLPVTGLPKITRFREGHTRFTIYDPDGNTLLFIAKDEPPCTYDSKMKDESKLMLAFETAVFLRDTYHNDEASAKKLDRALNEYQPAAPAELARVLAARAELAVALGQKERLARIRSALKQVTLTDTEQEKFRDELQAANELERLISAPGHLSPDRP